MSGHIRATLLLTAILLSACKAELRELCYDHSHGMEYNLSLKLNLKLDLEINLEVSEEAHTKIMVPDYMKVCFYNSQGGALDKTEFVKGYGGDLHVQPGTYDMVAYSFGTEWTQVRGEGSAATLEAFTSDITQTKESLLAAFTRDGEYDAPGPIIYTPDHLLVSLKQVEIPPFNSGERVITITATATTIVETYSFEAKNISGAEYISSAEAFVTNQARGNFFGRGEKSTEPATIYFPVEMDKTTGTLKTTFNTFGKLPGESRCYLHILLRDNDGNEYKISEDITDQFDDPDHRIIIYNAVDIPKPTGNGIAPSVEPWESENHDVPIG